MARQAVVVSRKQEVDRRAQPQAGLGRSGLEGAERRWDAGERHGSPGDGTRGADDGQNRS
jgi:hypothetical protein